jgi:hypothetical protein
VLSACWSVGSEAVTESGDADYFLANCFNERAKDPRLRPVVSRYFRSNFLYREMSVCSQLTGFYKNYDEEK